jgi:hypothetical protein
MDSEILRRMIPTKFSTAELPVKPPTKVWGGRATGKICSACDLRILGCAEIEAVGADARTRFYHAGCFTVPSVERSAVRGYRRAY